MIIVAKLKAQSGKEADVEQALKAILEDVEKEAGTLIYKLHRAQNDPTTFLFYEKYTDKGALKTHSATPYFKALFGKIGPLLDGSPQIEMYDEIGGFIK